MEIGEDWIYPLKTFSPSERVKILAIEKRKQTTRVDIEFLDGERAGRRENVPGTRLHGLWSTVVRYDRRMADWQRLSGVDVDETEVSAIDDAFSNLFRTTLRCSIDSFIRYGATVRDRAALELLMKRPLSDDLNQVEWFEDDDVVELSAAGTLMIAEYVCAANPLPILERVMAEEAEIREHCNRGREYDAVDGSGKQTQRRSGNMPGTSSIIARSMSCFVRGAVIAQSHSWSGSPPQRRRCAGSTSSSPNSLTHCESTTS